MLIISKNYSLEQSQGLSSINSTIKPKGDSKKITFAPENAFALCALPKGTKPSSRNLSTSLSNELVR